ncbi:protein YLS3-like [Gossypium australe]|uniref:Protein YLS3-like n=1 Tax=Gossypium australe TaxID=47621 RepID=A0A5B6VQL1_9ROSI|nr:protein YLS3-like [Gossypium australe]
MASSILPCILLITVLFGLASSDVNQDKAECKNHLMGLAPCLSFVDGEAKTPTVDCCGGLKQVLGKSKKCLCVVIRDRDDSSAGLKINATLAAALPSACRAKPFSIWHQIPRKRSYLKDIKS